MKDRALEYFAAFSKKDIDGLRRILAPDVSLLDWQVERKGLDEVLQEMEATFASFPAIQVWSERLISEGNLVMAELRIALDPSNVISVVDVLEFGFDGKLKVITAYKG